jgi:tRNA(Ile)-lysidine synthase
VRAKLKIDTSLLWPGMRLGVGLSGGADSVALLRALDERKAELGLVLHAAHLHHGLRGAEADGDLEFCRELAAKLNVEFHEKRVDTASEAKARGETIEEAARRLRYTWFRQLLSKASPHAVLDAVATAHTRDDQAETVLAKFLRGAWTEGLSGIYPVVHFDEGNVVRPLLGTARAEIEAFLKDLGQSWREDSSNRHTSFTRNRIRHELLPLLEGWNPRLKEHLAGMADLARDEEAWWRGEIDKIATDLILEGKPVRGGGRAAGGGLAIDASRLAALPPAVQRRLLRYAAGELGAATDFEATEALRELALTGRAGKRLELAQGLMAERTPRELRLAIGPKTGSAEEGLPEYTVAIPGRIAAEAFGVCLRIESVPDGQNRPAPEPRQACLRNWRAGDRVRLRYSSGPRKVKEVLERMKVTGSQRAVWPVLEMGGSIVWMKGVELEPEPGIAIAVETVEIAQDQRLP